MTIHACIYRLCLILVMVLKSIDAKSTREIADFVVSKIDHIIEFISNNLFDYWNSMDCIAKEINKEYGVWLSNRLVQILCSNQRLVRIIQLYIQDWCTCEAREEHFKAQICYCGCWTWNFVNEIKTKYFIDAKLLFK